MQLIPGQLNELAWIPQLLKDGYVGGRGGKRVLIIIINLTEMQDRGERMVQVFHINAMVT